MVVGRHLEYPGPCNIADFERKTHISDFIKKVYAKFHFCAMHVYHYMKKQ